MRGWSGQGFLDRFFVSFLLDYIFRRWVSAFYEIFFFNKIHSGGCSKYWTIRIKFSIQYIFTTIHSFSDCLSLFFSAVRFLLRNSLLPIGEPLFFWRQIYKGQWKWKSSGYDLCPEKNNDVVMPPQHFFRSKLFWFHFPISVKAVKKGSNSDGEWFSI